MRTIDEIRQRLEQAFHPEFLEVLDESERHRGHSGWREGGQTHFRVRMKAAALSDQSRIGRHRAVHRALGDELMGRIHALALELDG
ncbi:BolA protein [Albidovulum inexpectatum]|uniref:BolA protein n=1 Tax=Albidovulum inexpectatum TaxID=196587 RepID=A0A2S5JI87_9RHOB|nr:BolA family protein [Albidovulum inexpectatum]PPB81237.1 BolA protein [Albidovulum inexpectatum]